jgi:hypothetical protein
MFDETQKTVALEFARSLAARDYAQAYSMLSLNAQSRMSLDAMREQFEAMIPLDWGDVDPVELEENPAWDGLFIYVVLGGPVYSEAIIISSFASEVGKARVETFEFGRP